MVEIPFTAYSFNLLQTNKDWVESSIVASANERFVAKQKTCLSGLLKLKLIDSENRMEASKRLSERG